jgi:hypothetical protein
MTSNIDTNGSKDTANKANAYKSVQKGEITIDTVIYFFDIGAEAYKSAQQIFEKIDMKIHVEFSYAARAYASHIKSEGADKLALTDAFQASRHILNDALDLIISHANSKIKYLNKIASGATVATVYEDFPRVKSIIKKHHKIISESRRERGTFRLNEYEAMIKSNDYKVIIEFCGEIPDIEENLIKIRNDEKGKAYLILLAIAISIPASLFALFNLVKLLISK